MSSPALVIVLVEDRLQQTFVRRYLGRLGDRRVRDIRFVPLPGSRGCGEQYVRERYAAEVRACRLRAARTALVVAIDADTVPAERRTEQLRQALDDARQPVRADGEPIAHLIPKRNIETWILCLNGNDVDEETDYSGEHGIDQEVTTAAETFYNWSRTNVTPPPHCVTSLRTAIPEVRRLE